MESNVVVEKCHVCGKEAVAFARDVFSGETFYYCKEHFMALRHALAFAGTDSKGEVV
jgi:hypothetical protein